jgi:cephalosporin hydroxylase
MSLDLTIRIDHFIHPVPDPSVTGKLDAILGLLQTIVTKEDAMSAELDRLTAQVAATTTIEQSAITLIQGIAQQLRDAATDPAKITALADSLHTSADALAAAVTANTP